MTRLKVYCNATECKYNEYGVCERQYEFVNLNYEARCEDFEESEEDPDEDDCK